MRGNFGPATSSAASWATPRIVDRTLQGYVMFECIRALDYLKSREDVDPAKIMCTGASGGGMQSMYFAALDDRLEGSLATATWAMACGARMVRVHDVRATAQAALVIGGEITKDVAA